MCDCVRPSRLEVMAVLSRCQSGAPCGRRCVWVGGGRATLAHRDIAIEYPSRIGHRRSPPLRMYMMHVCMTTTNVRTCSRANLACGERLATAPVNSLSPGVSRLVSQIALQFVVCRLLGVYSDSEFTHEFTLDDRQLPDTRCGVLLTQHVQRTTLRLWVVVLWVYGQQ